MTDSLDSVGGFLTPKSLFGTIALGLLLLALASIVTLLIRRGTRRVERHLTDVTALGFVSAFAQLLAYLVAFVLYVHLIPQLRVLGTTLLAGVSIISVVVGIAAQSTLGNLLAGFSVVLSRTIRVGDTIHLSSPVGTIANSKVQLISLGYTVLIDADNHEVVVPNNVIMNSAITRVERAPDS